ncbi:hypothetical protein FACS189496_5510 [Bacilli bacterium]|nr:hypothetical protein FACS189496_5510 [Bacilli bacterium]
MLKESTGFDFKNIPTHDEKVLHMFNSIDSLCAKQPELMPDKIASFGIPEFNTKFTRDMLKTAKPKEFADLIRISGLSHGTDV